MLRRNTLQIHTNNLFTDEDIEFFKKVAEDYNLKYIDSREGL